MHSREADLSYRVHMFLVPCRQMKLVLEWGIHTTLILITQIDNFIWKRHCTGKWHIFWSFDLCHDYANSIHGSRSGSSFVKFFLCAVSTFIL